MNEVLDNAAIIRKLETDLEQARRDIVRLEKREEAAERSALEAVDEVRKFKAMIYGRGKPLPTFVAEQVQSQRVEPSKKENEAAAMTQSLTSDTTGTPPSADEEHAPVSPSPYQARRMPLSKDTPPAEIVVMSEPIPSPLKVEKSGGLAKREDLMAAEERADFLQTKLEASEDLVDALSNDIESARECIRTLVFKNVSLADRVHKLTRKLKEQALERDELLLSQHRLLKIAIYVGLLAFFIGSQEVYFATVLFIWLCLEAVK